MPDQLGFLRSPLAGGGARHPLRARELLCVVADCQGAAHNPEALQTAPASASQRRSMAPSRSPCS